MTIYDIEEHICCHSRMGANAVNLGEEKKNMKFGCQYTCIQNNMKSLAVRHTEEGRQNGDTRTKYFSYTVSQHEVPV